jgi:hypothetical protein
LGKADIGGILGGILDNELLDIIGEKTGPAGPKWDIDDICGVMEGQDDTGMPGIEE